MRKFLLAVILTLWPAFAWAQWIGPPNAVMCNRIAGFNGVAVATQLVAPTPGKTVYVCGFIATNSSNATTYNFSLNFGTQTTTPCDTGTVNIVSSLFVNANAVIDHQTYAYSSGALGAGLCVTPSNVALSGHVWYSLY